MPVDPTPLPPPRLDANTATRYRDALAASLTAQGFRVQVRGCLLTATNPAAVADDPRGKAMSPGLKQTVALMPRQRSWAWFWVWSGVTRDAPPDLEPLGPADDVATAAARIARVLAVPGEENHAGGDDGAGR